MPIFNTHALDLALCACVMCLCRDVDVDEYTSGRGYCIRTAVRREIRDGTMASMLPLRRLCGVCCACLRGEGGETADENEVDYLLPGGEWDPSVSGNARRPGSNRIRRGSRGRRRTRTNSEESAEDGSACAYVPPEVPGASTVPTFQDFKLLKTVGKGAFGKVETKNASAHTVMHLIILYYKHTVSTAPLITPAFMVNICSCHVSVAQVMLCVHTHTNVLYAMKVVPKTKIRTQKQINQILTELKILKLVFFLLIVVLVFMIQHHSFLSPGNQKHHSVAMSAVHMCFGSLHNYTHTCTCTFSGHKMHNHM